MPALIQFVDSIAASPTVRLDINDSAAWFCTNFSAPLPRLRRSESGNSMRDGGVVGSATYENRTLEIELTLVNTSTEDAAATEMQKLWRELDRPTNYLRYQREGMTKPVFFRLFRSDAADFEELWTTPIARNITIEILADPTALGLLETLGPYTVNNDPANASNPCYFDTSAALGDVPAPAVVVIDSSVTLTSVALARGANRHLIQAESMGGGTDTSNPAGGPDAAMSGTGTNNYMRTTFATNTAMVARLTLGSTLEAGTYRALVAVRRSEAASTIKVRLLNAGEATTQLTTSRQLVDLGLFSTRELLSTVGYAGISNSTTRAETFQLSASRDSGSGTLDWDYLLLVPASESFMFASSGTVQIEGLIVDGVAETAQAWLPPAGDPLLGTATPYTATVGVVGGFPAVVPGAASRFHFLQMTSGVNAMVNVRSASVRVAYWPRYLMVRPVST